MTLYPLDPTNRRLVVAVHEAGHCVAALEYGLRISHATIRRTYRDGKPVDGHVAYYRLPTYPAVARATITIAGLAATSLVFRDRDGYQLTGEQFNLTAAGCHGDLGKLDAIRAEGVDPDLSHVGPLLIRRFARLAGIARALLDDEYLLGMKIEAIAEHYDDLSTADLVGTEGER